MSNFFKKIVNYQYNLMTSNEVKTNLKLMADIVAMAGISEALEHLRGSSEIF